MLDHPGKGRNNLNQWLFSEDPCQQPVDALASDKTCLFDKGKAVEGGVS